MGSKRELADLLAEVALFSGCTTRVRRAVAHQAHVLAMPAGVNLVREGEPGDALVVILEGEAITCRAGVEVSRVGPGSYFGELAILDGEPRSATVTAVTDMRVAVIGTRAFRVLLREYSDLAEQLLVVFAGELREARQLRDGR